MLRKWRCVICGDEIIEGQRFTVLRDGFVHLECLFEKLVKEGRLSQDIAALMDAVEVLNYLIVRIKEAKRLASSREVIDMLEAVRIDAEKHAAQISSLLERMAGLGGERG
ncbi:protein of unknown function DUF2175 [Pyrolobus fumarii 1A]|uniref:DUF2175 domain-containing protein n=1 Tax=Pyrolobus fumarii (strain DSM 11204 / 1A) TaxID=694429 RepID=G0ED30_PYRF1|nr:DUF2175 domain-containing protein [Pyrolobus fumarii]AEM38589.1 protein of unknown function DUF2175 [Pyrolobus fumarii 1A]